jgi:hypothetical protein
MFLNPLLLVWGVAMVGARGVTCRHPGAVIFARDRITPKM